jgi:hypothetical protein
MDIVLRGGVEKSLLLPEDWTSGIYLWDEDVDPETVIAVKLVDAKAATRLVSIVTHVDREPDDAGLAAKATQAPTTQTIKS